LNFLLLLSGKSQTIQRRDKWSSCHQLVVDRIWYQCWLCYPGGYWSHFWYSHHGSR